MLYQLHGLYLLVCRDRAVPPRGAGTVLVAACPMLLLTNTVSGRRLFRKQPPEFCIECRAATILVSRQPYNVVRYISYVPHIQLEGIEHEEIHRDAN